MCVCVCSGFEPQASQHEVLPGESGFYSGSAEHAELLEDRAHETAFSRGEAVLIRVSACSSILQNFAKQLPCSPIVSFSYARQPRLLQTF